ERTRSPLSTTSRQKAATPSYLSREGREHVCLSRLKLRLEQPMQVDDHVLHLGIVDRALGVAAPGFFSRGITRVDPDDVDLVEVLEFHAPGVDHPAAHYQMQQLLRHRSSF